MTRRSDRLQGKLISLLMGLLITAATAASFAQSGSPVSISNSGTPSYSMPFSVPPGISGMKPNLGLLYSGSGVNGPVGYGWTVQGISMITRCKGSVAYDGYPAPVTFGVNDKLCLDGHRLIQTDANGNVVNGSVTAPSLVNRFQSNDSLGGSGQVTEYRTDQDMYARIRSYGAAGGNTANGPAYFEVWTKSGQIYEYGINNNTTSNAQITAEGSTVVTAWPVSRINDTVGNYIDFQYIQRDVTWGSVAAGGNNPGIGHEWNLQEVRYTGNASQVPTNKIVFTYADRADNPGGPQDRSEAYHQGSKNVSVQLLQSVTTYINWPANQTTQPSNAVAVKTWNVNYTKSATTNRSLVHTISECTGNGVGTPCLPPTTFNYSAGGGANYTNFSTFSLAYEPMQDFNGANGASSVGVLTGNFYGSGRLDILKWSDSPGLNLMFQNNGGGNFGLSSTFNITNTNLFSSNGCYYSVAADFNGDGLTDILRIMNPSNAACGTPVNILYLSNGDGTFNATTLPSTINFTQSTSQRTSVLNKLSQTVTVSQTQGQNYYILDVNNDGILDIVTTTLPAFASTTPPASDAVQCATIVCTHVYLGQPGGGFVEYTGTNLANRSVYAAPTLTPYSALWRYPFVADVNGDGMADLIVANGTWISRGNGNFDLGVASINPTCSNLIDFNGDGRADCLSYGPTGAAASLWVADGTGPLRSVSNFNLTGAGQQLSSFNAAGTQQTIGIQLGDIDGDGRTDIIRWEDDPTQNMVYLSNGDGTFRTSNFNLNTTATQLQKSDGSASFITGDFTGNGNVEILRLVTGVSSTLPNELFVKTNPTLPDMLASVTTGTGLTTQLTWVNLNNSSSGSLGNRYANDRGTANAATYPVADMNMPLYVVATATSQSGAGGSVSTEYAYQGLKIAYDGRGWLGFRRTLTQHTGPNGSPLTVWTSYLQSAPYIGMANYTETYPGYLTETFPTGVSNLLSSSTYIYCDTTSATLPTAATMTAPCATTSQVQRPYLYQSIDAGNDLNGAELPTITTTNTFNSTGDPTQIVVNTQGLGVGLNQSFTKTVNNVYQLNNTSGTSWILGRLQSATVTNTISNDLPSIPTSAGTSTYATAIDGSGAVPAHALPTLVLSSCVTVSPVIAPANATLTCTLGNTGQMSAAGISYSSIAGAAVTGPTSCAASTTNCGTVIVTNSTVTTTANGTLTITPGADTASLGNGAPVSTPVSLTVNSPPILVWGTNGNANCAMTTPTMTPTQASMSCPLYNAGQTAATGVTYSSASGTTVSGGPTTCAAGTAANPVYCGLVTVTTGTAATQYSTNMVATAGNGGTATAATAQSLLVQTVPTLLNNCTQFAATPPTMTSVGTPASMTCNVSNSGQATAQSIAYSFQYDASSSITSGLTISGPTGQCAGTPTPNTPNSCGTVTVTTPSTATYVLGTLTAVPNVGQSGSAKVQLEVNSPVALTLTNCTSTSPTAAPTAATMSCMLMNTGQTPATSITYSASGGLTAAGPTSCAAATVPGGVSANCGTVTVTSPTTASAYTGTLTATPNSGAGASTAVNVSVLTPTVLTLTGCSSTSPTTAPTAATMSCTLSNSGQYPASAITYASTGSTTVTGPASCAGSASCGTVVVHSGTTAATYTGTVTATPKLGTAASAAVSLVVRTPAALALTGCSSVTAVTSPATASMSCTLSNTGQTPITTVEYTTAASTTVSGPTSCAASAACGTVAVTTSSAAATYSGTLTATPNAGSAASAAINLIVNIPPTPPNLQFSGCVTAPTGTGQTDMVCTLTNLGQSTAASIKYSLVGTNTANMSVTGPGACAAGAICGKVTVVFQVKVVPMISTTYLGSVNATPNVGTAATQSYNVTIPGIAIK